MAQSSCIPYLVLSNLLQLRLTKLCVLIYHSLHWSGHMFDTELCRMIFDMKLKTHRSEILHEALTSRLQPECSNFATGVIIEHHPMPHMFWKETFRKNFKIFSSQSSESFHEALSSLPQWVIIGCILGWYLGWFSYVLLILFIWL